MKHENRAIMKILVTGAAGFIGCHLAKVFLDGGHQVVGVDDLNHFTYPARIKYARLETLGLSRDIIGGRSFGRAGSFTFQRLDIADTASVKALVIDGDFDLIVHLAGMTSVEASTLSPQVFHDTIVTGMFNVMDALRDLPEDRRARFVYASSAAVYGNSGGSREKLREDDRNLLKPDSIYGLCKCMCEDLAATYCRLFGVRSVGLRLFNIYGPFARPDTFASIVCECLRAGREIPLYDNGRVCHDFMYITDCTELLRRICLEPAEKESPCEIVNVSDPRPVSIGDFVRILEDVSGLKATVRPERLPRGEITSLIADTTKLAGLYPYTPVTDLRDGLKRYYEWYLNFNGSDAPGAQA